MGQIITNLQYLSEKYIPDKLLHREKEKVRLVNNLKNEVSTLIYGSPGSGKTSLVKHVLKRLNKSIFATYVDCSIYQTTYSVLKEIVPRGPLILARSNYELIKELKREVKKRKFIVCLDGFEKLRDKDLVRKFLLLGLTLILITDNEDNLTVLTEDVRSRLAIMKIEPYTSEQTFQILKNRAEKGLVKWSFTDSLLRKIVEKSKGNMTLALNLLKLSAVKAESEGKRNIGVEDIPEVEDCPLKLSEDEKVLLNILRIEKSLPAGKLYELYLRNVRYPKSERSFRNYMARLCSKGLVRCYGEKRGRVYEIQSC